MVYLPSKSEETPSCVPSINTVAPGKGIPDSSVITPEIIFCDHDKIEKKNVRQKSLSVLIKKSCVKKQNYEILKIKFNFCLFLRNFY